MNSGDPDLGCALGPEEPRTKWRWREAFRRRRLAAEDSWVTGHKKRAWRFLMSFVPRSRGLTGIPALLAVSLVAPASAQERAEKAAASAPAESAAQSAGAARVSRGPFRVIVEQDGVLVPSQATALGFWPLALEGELRIEEVAAHGARGEENDVMLRLRDEKARDAIREARWARRAGESSLAAARARAADEEADAERDLARAEKDLELARSSFQGYVEVDRALDKEEYEAS